jgi:exosome complex component RRP4
LILGLNGYIWVNKHVQDSDHGEEGFDAEAVYSNQNDVRKFPSCSVVIVFIHFFKDIDVATRTAIARICNIIRLLADHFVPLTDTRLLEAYDWVIEHDVDTKDIIHGDVGDALVAMVGSDR